MLLAYACLVHYLPGPHLRTVSPWDVERAREFVDQMGSNNQIVVAVTSKPLGYAYLNGESLQSLKESTFLRLERTIVPLQGFIRPSYSLSGEALFIFQRPSRTLHPSGTLRFVTEFKAQDGTKVRLNHAFKVRKLLFQGKPEY
jgi:hypothetical protein